jgi:hypothetical protein
VWLGHIGLLGEADSPPLRRFREDAGSTQSVRFLMPARFRVSLDLSTHSDPHSRTHTGGSCPDNTAKSDAYSGGVIGALGSPTEGVHPHARARLAQRPERDVDGNVDRLRPRILPSPSRTDEARRRPRTITPQSDHDELLPEPVLASRILPHRPGRCPRVVHSAPAAARSATAASPSSRRSHRLRPEPRATHNPIHSTNGRVTTAAKARPARAVSNEVRTSRSPTQHPGLAHRMS